MDMLPAALGYIQIGWPVFPLLPRSQIPYRGSHGVKDATTNAAKVQDWWTQTPETNVAIATGREAGVIVLDVDPRRRGDHLLATLEARHGPLPATVEAATGGGGRHLLFAHPGGKVRNRIGSLGKGLDLKADGGYIVAPPSVHPTGTVYEWQRHPDTAPISPAPEWVIVDQYHGFTGGTHDMSVSPVSPVSHGVASSVEDVLRSTVPDGAGWRHRCIFALARGLKSLPEYANAKAGDCKPVVRQWHQRAVRDPNQGVRG